MRESVIISAVRTAGTQRPDDGLGPYTEETWQLQITAATSPGSSGSPILSDEAKVVGVAVGKYSGEALNFGIPANLLREVLAQVREVQPLSVLKTGRSLTTNLIITGIVLAGVVGLFYFVQWLLRVGSRRKPNPGAAGRRRV